MDLASALAAERERGARKGPRCTVCSLLDELQQTDRDALEAALEDASVPHMAISRALRESGYPVKGDTVGRHRRGECDRR